MTSTLALTHLLNFLEPACGVGLLMGVAEGLARWRQGGRSGWMLQLAAAWAQHTAVGAAVLMLGLALLERDGKMLTYTALVLSLGLLAAWRTRR
jgi:hypothetical protein